jgi:GTP-binding protein HflX
MWTHLNREVGSGQSRAIGARGPGEKQIEIDRRLLRRKITELQRELAALESVRRRMAESRSPYFTVSLVGYTNAGKSTLLRKLTGADALVADQLFSTLDTQTRAWELPGGKRIFLSDTVGFIRHLPHHLVASFHATLEEVRTADLILHVVDASHADARLPMEAVDGVLASIGAEATPRVLVLNKVDRVADALDLVHLREGEGPVAEAVPVSARTGAGIDRLAEAVSRHVSERQQEAEMRVPATAGRLLAFLAERGTVLERRYDDGIVALRVRLGRADLARATRMLEDLGPSE